MAFLNIVVGILGVFMLVKLLVGSVAAGLDEAGRQLEGREGGPQPAIARRHERAQTIKTSVLSVAGVLAISYALYGLFWQGNGQEDPKPDADPVAGQAGPSLPDLDTPEEMDRFAVDSEQATAASVQRAQVASAKVKQQQVLFQGKQVLEAIDAWEDEIDLWDIDVSGLMTSEEGKILATQPSLVERYRALVAEERPDRVEADQVRSLVQALIEPVQLAYDNPGDISLPEEDVGTQLAELLNQARQGRDAYRTPRLRIATLVSYAKQRGGAGEKTLADVVTEQEEQENLEQTALIEAEAQKAQDEVAERLATERAALIKAQGDAEAKRIEQERKAVELLGEQEAQRIAEEAAAAKRKMEQELAEQLAAKEKELRRQEFEQLWPKMQGYLTPFTADGFMQPEGNGYVRTAERGPVSFAALEGSGKLEKTIQALQALSPMRIGSDKNDRPLGGFPSYRPGIDGWTNEMQETTSQVQDFLIRYGEIMVEKGLLAP